MKAMRVIVIFFLAIAIALPGVVFAGEALEKQAKEYYDEALKAHKNGDITQAITLYAKAIYTKPDFAKAHNNLGVAYEQNRNRERAEQEYHRAIEIDSTYSIALQNLALIHLERGEYDAFYELWKRASGLDEESYFLLDSEEE